MTQPVSVGIIGAGLAGCEAALILARAGIRVELFEMRPGRTTPAHATGLPAELVCSNSFKSFDLPSAHALLKNELRLLASPLLEIAQQHRVPAGSALAVDRMAFATAVKEVISRNPLIKFTHQHCAAPHNAHSCWIIAAGPLCSTELGEWLQTAGAADALNFYDAIAPIVSLDSIDTAVAFFAARRDDGSADYLNCPFTKEEYDLFFNALVSADTIAARSFEDAAFFEGCLPIEVIASRGYDALRYGPMRPIGLTDPRTGRWPFAALQLRRETAEGDAFNLVGFQTRLAMADQQRVFRLIPGLATVEFLRYGSIHRNTYIDAPKVLSNDLSMKAHNNYWIAGQLCGNEGYTESIATGHLAARFVAARIQNRSITPLPRESACGALVHRICHSDEKKFTPVAVNFGMMPAIENRGRKKPGKKEKQTMVCDRALGAMGEWIGANAL